MVYTIVYYLKRNQIKSKHYYTLLKHLTDVKKKLKTLQIFFGVIHFC